MFQPVTPNIPGWAEPIEPGLGELHSGSDEEPFWLPSQFPKREKSHEIWEWQVTPHPLLLPCRAVDVSKRPTPPSRPVSEYDYWDARRRFCQQPFNSDVKSSAKAFYEAVWLLGVNMRFFSIPVGALQALDISVWTHIFNQSYMWFSYNHIRL